MLSRPLHVSDEEKQGSEKSMRKISNLRLSKWFTERGDPKLPPGLPRVNKSAATLAFPRRSTSTLREPHDLRVRTERTTLPVREGLRSVTGNACLHPTPNASSSWAAEDYSLTAGFRPGCHPTQRPCRSSREHRQGTVPACTGSQSQNLPAWTELAERDGGPLRKDKPSAAKLPLFLRTLSLLITKALHLNPSTICIPAQSDTSDVTSG